MAFYARNFLFNDVPSEMYGLIISSDDSGEGTSPTSNIEIKTQQIFRRPVPYFYGSTQSSVLEFDVTFRTTEEELTAIDASLVQAWLFSQQNYGTLRVIQPDMEDIFFRCFFVDAEIVRVGNIIRGFNAKVVCDSPFAWGSTKTFTFTASDTNKTHILYNESENSFYTYPYIVINKGSSGSFVLTNITDGNREFKLSGLLSGETVTVDNDLQILTATQSVSILSKLGDGIANHPKNFFRLLKGVNRVTLNSSITSATISYIPMKRMG
jgi:phage-related protein